MPHLQSPETAIVPIINTELVSQAPEDPLYSLVAAYDADNDPNKVDLGVGAYRDNAGKPWILPVVKKADEVYRSDPSLNHEYIPIAGLPEFCSAARALILGNDSCAIKEKRVSTFQTISGTGAVHLGAAFLSKFLPQPLVPVYISAPTWPIHQQCFENSAFEIRHYPYWEPSTKTFDIDRMLASLNDAPRGSLIVLHVCAHNPTGLDPTPDQWKQLAGLMRKRVLFPFFDCAYQGFATGSLAEDNFAIRYFEQEGFELVIAQSFAKNLGLYGQRVGAFHYVTPSGPNAQEITKRISSQLSIIQRSELSSPPIYGAKIASIILKNEQLLSEWKDDLRTMAGRIKAMRKALRSELERLQTPGTWQHITSQIGMFSFTGLSKEQVAELRNRWHVYMAETGRISVAGLNENNVAYFARAVDDVVKRIQ